jgi:hypothetical protein
MLLINNDLIWISIPKNASYSVHLALNNTNLNIQYSSKYNTLNHYKGFIDYPNKKYSHLHIQKNDLIKEWGNKETICITRNFVDRFISAIQFVWKKIEENGYTPIIPIYEIDNEFIYKLFTSNIIFDIHNDFTINKNKHLKFFQSIIKEKINIKNFFVKPHSLICQNYYKNSSKCNYEFDINELDKFKNFIDNRYNTNIVIEIKNNNTNKEKTKIIKDTTFIKWLYNNFEKPYDTNIKNII